MKQYIISVSSEFNDPSHYNSKQTLKDLLVTHEVHQLQLNIPGIQKHYIYISVGDVWELLKSLHLSCIASSILFQIVPFVLCHLYVHPTFNKLFSSSTL